MPDRRIASPLVLFADLPTTGLTGTVTVTDGYNASMGSASFSFISSRRYRASVPITFTNVVEGFWTALWDYGSGTFSQSFTVGSDSGMTKYQLRYLAARRVDDVYAGTIAEATASTIVDDDLLGGTGDHVGKWVIPSVSSTETGMAKRVTDFNGTTLSLSSPFANIPAVGDDYLLFDSDLQPRSIDDSIAQAVQSLAAVALIRVRTNNLTPDTNGIVSVPSGWENVHEVWITDDTGARTFIAEDAWSMSRDRTITLDGSDTTWSVELYGTRLAAAPLWDDSILDINSAILIPAVAHTLHLDSARGQATDSDAHLQRSQIAFQEFGAQMTLRLPRVPRTTRRVID